MAFERGYNYIFYVEHISRLSRMNAPLIASVNGVAAGAGLSFVGFADLAVCSEKASFVSAYAKAGLTPDVIPSSYFLPSN